MFAPVDGVVNQIGLIFGTDKSEGWVSMRRTGGVGVTQQQKQRTRNFRKPNQKAQPKAGLLVSYLSNR